MACARQPHLCGLRSGPTGRPPLRFTGHRQAEREAEHLRLAVRAIRRHLTADSHPSQTEWAQVRKWTSIPATNVRPPLLSKRYPDMSRAYLISWVVAAESAIT
eukprot:3683463-Rhodomonas_salina.1